MCLSIRDGDWHKASRPGRVLVGQTWCWIKSSVANKLLYVLPALSTLPCWRFSSCSQRACARATKLLYVLFTSLQPPLPPPQHTHPAPAGRASKCAIVQSTPKAASTFSSELISSSSSLDGETQTGVTKGPTSPATKERQARLWWRGGEGAACSAHRQPED